MDDELSFMLLPGSSRYVLSHGRRRVDPADPTHTVAQRHRQLAEALRGAGESAREPAEPIAELVPKRNIETWIHALDGPLSRDLARPLDEETAYPKLERESECAGAAQVFADHARAGSVPGVADAVPSLRDGHAELRRLPL